MKYNAMNPSPIFHGVNAGWFRCAAITGLCCVFLLNVQSPLFAAKESQPSKDSRAGSRQSSEEIVFKGDEPGKQPVKENKGSYSLGSFWELFSTDISLAIPLSDVVILVILVNIFALFKATRLIMATSYIFALKWVFWSNYSELIKHSDTIARGSTWVFVLCGILTVILFAMNYFNRQ